MDGRIDLALDDAAPVHGEAAIRAVLEQSRLDIAQGRIVAMAPVLDAMRAAARRVREAREADGGRAAV